MAEKIERVRVRLFRLLGEFLKADTALCERLDNFAALVRVGPAGAEFLHGRSQRAHGLGRIFGITHHAKLFAVRIEFMNEMSHHLNLAAIEVKLPRLASWRVDDIRPRFDGVVRSLGFGLGGGSSLAFFRYLFFSDAGGV